jgi:predicted NUDIX family phosphoesterase
MADINDMEYADRLTQEKIDAHVKKRDKASEQVLCVPTRMIDKYDDFELLVNCESTFMFRGSPDGELEGAETNKRWKQVIPYFTLVRNGMILTYKKNKSSSEIRLHDKYSIGIGGHVNDRDGTGMSAVRTAAIRECKEEIGVIPKLSGNKDDYVVIDIKGEAADYHIGYCQIITEWQPEGIKLSEEVDKISWKTIAELEKLDLEEWSLFVLELLKKDFIFESEVR